MPLVKCPDGIGSELVVTFWLNTGALLAVDTATEYEVAPGETFQVKVGVSVVTVWPGCEEPPGARPVGVTGATVVAVTVTAWVPDEQVLAVVCDADSQTRMLIVSATSPGFIGIVISVDAIVGVLLLLFQL